MARFVGALLRGMLVAGLVLAPEMILPGLLSDQRPVLALIALFAATLTLLEYRAAYPGLIEFRDAPPYNRLRFALLLALLVAGAMAARSELAPAPLYALIAAIGVASGAAFGLDWGPVALMAKTLIGAGTDSVTAYGAAGLAFLVTLVALAVFVLILRRNQWPVQNADFNFWVNLPTFDPSLGGDVVRRLDRDGRIYLALGIIMPFVIPAMLQGAAMTFQALDLSSPLTRIWAVSVWAFLPASLFMRGIALGRIARMIRARRAQAARPDAAGYIAA